jgi:prepilin-type N-terminal cleavage/methylation domain-containing protein
MVKAYWRRAREKRLNIGREGFTLVEVLIVVTVISILAALSVVRSDVPRNRAAAATMQSDLRNLASAQEAYYSKYSSYASDVSALDLRLSPRVTMEINTSPYGWTARATHEQVDDRECALAFGDIAPLSPATGSGVILCGEASGGGLGCGG